MILSKQTYRILPVHPSHDSFDPYRSDETRLSTRYSRCGVPTLSSVALIGSFWGFLRSGSLESKPRFRVLGLKFQIVYIYINSFRLSLGPGP